MSKSSQHVTPTANGHWSVRKSGSKKATKIFDTKEEAVKFARDIAKSSKSDLYIHKKDGTIANKDSFGEDPSPPKDQK